MEENRPFKKVVLSFGFVVFLLWMSGCGVNSSSKTFLELNSSYPAHGESNVRTFGRYFLVFNEPIAYQPGDAVFASFPVLNLYSSHETLYVERDGDVPQFEHQDSILVSSLTNAEGRAEAVRTRILFATAAGEHEDNNSLLLADTLKSGRILDGRVGKGDGAPSDEDWFILISGASKCCRVQIDLLGTTPVYCIVNMPDTVISVVYPKTDSARTDTMILPNKVLDLGLVHSASFFGPDSVRFRLTNFHTQRYQPGGWYRLTVAGL